MLAVPVEDTYIPAASPLAEFPEIVEWEKLVVQPVTAYTPPPVDWGLFGGAGRAGKNKHHAEEEHTDKNVDIRICSALQRGNRRKHGARANNLLLTETLFEVTEVRFK